MRDVLNAITACKDSITNLDGNLESIKGEIFSMSHELNKTVVRITALEERLSTVEDDLYPLK